MAQRHQRADVDRARPHPRRLRRASPPTAGASTFRTRSADPSSAAGSATIATPSFVIFLVAEPGGVAGSGFDRDLVARPASVSCRIRERGLPAVRRERLSLGTAMRTSHASVGDESYLLDMMGANRMRKAGRLVALALVALRLTLGIGIVVAGAATSARGSRERGRPGSPIATSGSSATDASEPNGYFRSDNLTSNELGFERVDSGPGRRARGPGGVYLGVGPEQNFTYIAAAAARDRRSSSTSAAATCCCS